MIGNLDRNEILVYRDKNKKIDSFKTLVFSLPFNFNSSDIKNFFSSYKYSILNSDLFKKID